MKLNLKTIAIAAALASLAGVSQAALTSATTPNSSLALVAYNTTNNNWYIRDLGYLLNSFLPTGVNTLPLDGGALGDKSPTAGLTINSTGAGGALVKSNFSDSAFGTWYTDQGVDRLTNVRWMVGAYDSTSAAAAPSGPTQRRMVVSSTNAAETTLNSNLDSFSTTSFFGSLGTFFGTELPGEPTRLSKTGSSVLPKGDGSFQAGVTLGAVGTAQNLFYVVRSAYTGSGTSAATTTAFGNATGLATITLGADGEVVYSLAGVTPPPPSEVPVPAAVWLLGSGLLAMGASARRRRAAAAQA